MRRKARARAGRVRRTVPSAPTRNGGVLPPAHDRRTRVGLRTGPRGARRRSRETVSGRSLLHETHGYGSEGRVHVPSHAVSGRPSNALEARSVGWSWKRDDDSNVVLPRSPAARSSALSGAVTSGCTQASTA